MEERIGTITGKGRELVDAMERRMADIACVQEPPRKTWSIVGGFKLFYHGID